MRKLLIGFVWSAGAIVSPLASAQTQNIFVATGPTTGVYYPIGGAMADVLTKNIPGLNATAGTTTRLRRVELSIPPTTATASGPDSSTPVPIPSAGTIIAMMIVRDVMRMGRSRRGQASASASSTL